MAAPAEGGDVHIHADSPPKRWSPARSGKTSRTMKTARTERSSERPRGGGGAAPASNSVRAPDAVDGTGDRAAGPSDEPRGPPSLGRPSGADLLTKLAAADAGAKAGTAIEEADSTRGVMRGRSGESGSDGDLAASPATPPGGNVDDVSGYKNLSRSERLRLLREVKQVLGEESVFSGHSADGSPRRDGRSGARQVDRGDETDDDDGSAVDTAFYTSATFETDYTRSGIDTAFYTQATDYTAATGATGYTTECTGGGGDTAFYTEADTADEDADEEYRRHRYREKKSSRARLSCTSPAATGTYDEDESLLLAEDEEEDFLDMAGACISMLCGGGAANDDRRSRRKESSRNDDMSLNTMDTFASESRAESHRPITVKERLCRLEEESRRQDNSTSSGSDRQSASHGTGDHSGVQYERDEESELADVHRSAGALSLAPSGVQETVEMTHSMVQRAATPGERSDGAVVPDPPLRLADDCEAIERTESSGAPAASAIVNDAEAFWRGDGVWNADPSVFGASAVADEGAEAFERAFSGERGPEEGVGSWSDDGVWNADPSLLDSGGRSGSSPDPSLQTDKAAKEGMTNGPGGALQLNMDGTTAEFDASGAARATPVSSGTNGAPRANGSANMVVAKPPSMQQAPPEDDEAELLGEEARHLSNVSRTSVLKRVSSIGRTISSRQREKRKGRDETFTVPPEKDSTSHASAKKNNSTKATKSTLSSSRKTPRAWREYRDPQSELLYYSNGITTVWERPANVDIVPLACSASNRSGSTSQASSKQEPPSTSKRGEETSSKDRPPLDGDPRRAARSRLRLFSFRRKKSSAAASEVARRSADERPKEAGTPEPLTAGQSDKSKATGRPVPASPARTERTESDASGSDSSAEGNRQHRAGAAGKWREYRDGATGKSYYSNGLETTWTMPPELVADSALAQMRLDAEKRGGQREQQLDGPAGQGETRRKSKKGGKRRWREFLDPASGNLYYSDGVTTTWARPDDFLAAL